MAWQFNNTGLGYEIGEGLRRADEYTDRRKDRAQEELRQKALDDLAGLDLYQKRKVDESGRTIGYELDDVNFNKDKAYVERRLPGYKKSEPTIIKSYQQNMMDAGINPASGEYLAPQAPPAPPPAPAPLLSNPNETKIKEKVVDNAMQEAADNRSGLSDVARSLGKSVLEPVGEAKATGRVLPDGSIEKIQPTNKGISFDEGVSIVSREPERKSSPPPYIPPPIVAQETSDPLDVSPAMLKRLREQVTTPNVNKLGEADNSVADLSTWSPELKEEMGVTNFGNIKLPWTAINRIKAAKDAKEGGGIDPAIYSLARQVRSGRMTVGEALEEFNLLTEGKEPNKREVALLTNQSGQAAMQEKTDFAKEKEEKKTEADQKKEESRKEQARKKANIVVQDATRALKILEGQRKGIPGAVRQFGLSYIPGSEESNLEALLQTVRTIGGFEELQAMRDASKTGAALGPVSDKENAMLQSTIGNLDKATSPELRAENLKRVINTYLDIIHGPGNGPKRYELGFDEEGKPIQKIPSASRKRIESAKKLKISPKQIQEIDGAPRPGDVVDGYRYKGGDPSKKSNWEKVK